MTQWRFSQWSSFLLGILICFHVLAKTPAYKNEEDSAFKIKTVFLEPFSDNLNLIYAKKAEEKIKGIIENENQWQLADKKSDADLVIESRLTKNPKSFTLKMNLIFKTFSIQDSKEIDNIFETEKILGHYENLYASLKSRIPYQGIILSRNQDQVTINIGSAHGAVANQEVLAIHIAKLNLHPKTNAYLSSEKVILGKVQLTKVDEYLSFGKILFEREPQILKKETKIEFSKLDRPSLASTPRPEEGFAGPSDSPKGEWVPRQAPQYGRISITGGLVQYTQNINFQTSGSKTISQWITPTVKGSAELWLNPQFHMELFIRQSTFKVSNPLEGSEPGSLNISLSQYQVKAKYNYELESEARSPQFQVALGIGSFQALADKSNPLSLSNQSYGGALLGFKGIFPVSEENPVDLGIYFNYFLSKTIKDSSEATTSGVQINDFGAILRYNKSLNLAYVFELSFESYSTDLDATTGTRTDPASNISNRLMTTLAGIEYSF